MQHMAPMNISIGIITTAKRNPPIIPPAMPISTCERLGAAKRSLIL